MDYLKHPTAKGFSRDVLEDPYNLAAAATPMERQACRDDGWRAGVDGRKKTDNPHTPNSPQWVAWDHGWDCWSSEYGLDNEDRA